ncbi:MAG: hypothetical protein WEE89_15125 [Gemmatimonadota bacterium]
MAGLELRPRAATEIVDAAFQLYTRNFATLVSISAIVFAPFVIANLLLTGGDQTLVLTRPATFIALGIIGWIFNSIVEAGIALAVSDSYLQGGSDVGTVMRRVMARVGPVILAVLAKTLIVALGLFVGLMAGIMTTALAGVGLMGGGGGGSQRAAVIFGVIAVTTSTLLGGFVALYYYACYFAVPATVILENLGVRAGLSRSRALSKGVKRKVLTTLGTSVTVLFVLQMVISLMMQALPGPPAIGFALEQVATVVLAPIIGVIATLLYYDARIINEGFDIEMMAADLGTTAPVTAPSVTTPMAVPPTAAPPTEPPAE